MENLPLIKYPFYCKTWEKKHHKWLIVFTLVCLSNTLIIAWEFVLDLGSSCTFKVETVKTSMSACMIINSAEHFHFYQMVIGYLTFNHPVIHGGCHLKNTPFSKNPWRLYPENTPFFWKSWTMPSTEKYPLSLWNCRRAWLPLLKLIAVTGATLQVPLLTTWVPIVLTWALCRDTCPGLSFSTWTLLSTICWLRIVTGSCAELISDATWDAALWPARP